MRVPLRVIAIATLTATPVIALAAPVVAPPASSDVSRPGHSIDTAGLASEDAAALAQAPTSNNGADLWAPELPPVRVEDDPDPSGRLASADDDPDSGEDSGEDENGSSDDSSDDDNSTSDETSSDGPSGEGSSEDGSSEDGSDSDDTSGDSGSGDSDSGDDSRDDSHSDSDVAAGGGETAPRTSTGGQGDRSELDAIVDELAALLAESTDPKAAALADRLATLGLAGGNPASGAAGASVGENAEQGGGRRTSTGGAGTPAALLDMSAWKLTLPGGKEGSPTEILPPDLKSFTENGVFHMSREGDGVVFRAEVGGATTKNSDYPRSELREMASAEEEAAWSNTSGTHTLDVRQAITEVPPVKPHVVAAQIHDGKDDVLQIRLEDKTLAVQYNDGNDQVVIDPDYQLGTPYDLRIVAEDGRVVVFYNGKQAAELPLNGSSWYYKVGAYTQSNPAKGDKAGAAGEVVVYDLAIDHGGSPR
jgi:alginate lyase